MKGDFTLLSAGGAVLILNDNEFLLSTGTPTTDHVSHPTNQLAQDDNSHWGKILKFTFNAGLPKVTIFSKGHRNPQGIAKVNGEIFAVEHGPRGGDEINLITEGTNYGWPLHSFGSEYDLAEINKDDKNIKNHGLPIYSFMPSVGISSVAQCPNNYLTYYAPFRCLTVASMRAGAIFFVVFDGSKVLFTERLDIGSRLRKIFVVDNQITAITGELSELTEKYIP
jgi:glucose/arabinose dehydrogenase